MTADHVRSEPGCTWIVGLPALIAILCQFAAGPAAALEWEYEGVDISFDTTLSQGVSVRASERDPATIIMTTAPSTTTTAKSLRMSPGSPVI
jgi:hypothetical protein